PLDELLPAFAGQLGLGGHVEHTRVALARPVAELPEHGAVVAIGAPDEGGHAAHGHEGRHQRVLQRMVALGEAGLRISTDAAIGQSLHQADVAPVEGAYHRASEGSLTLLARSSKAVSASRKRSTSRMVPRRSAN